MQSVGIFYSLYPDRGIGTSCLLVTVKIKKPECTQLYDVQSGSMWLGRKDLNPRMSESESDALPLGDSPIKYSIIIALPVGFVKAVARTFI